MKKLLLLFVAVISVSLLIVSCAPEPKPEPEPKEYDVFIPVFLEDEEEGSKAIPVDEDNMYDLIYYMMCPPFTGFKAGKMTSGSKLSKKIAGTDVELVFTHTEDGYSYEYSGADDYFKITVDESDDSFDYVHAINIDMSTVPGSPAYDELAIIQGRGAVLNGGHFEAYGTMYELRTGAINSSRVRFVLKSNGANLAYCEYTGNSKDTDILGGKDKFTTFDASEYDSYLDELNRDAETVTKIHAVKMTNGRNDGDANAVSLDEIEAIINSWGGFGDWDVSGFVEGITDDNDY